MIKDIFLWNGNINRELNYCLDDPEINQINIFAGEEWEVNANWHNIQYFPRLVEFANTKELNIIVGCHNTELHHKNFVCPKNAKIHYWPTHWIHHTADKLRLVRFPKQLLPKKLFLSLNNKAHFHRCMMMDYLCKNDLLKHGDVSWHEVNVQYNFRWWKMEKMILDGKYPQMLNSYNTLPDGFSDTFISLVAEANMKAHFITEKTWMPIFFKRPFIIFGPQGIHKEMSYLGFKMFDEIIDYTFDTYEHMEDRCQSIMNILKDLSDKDLSYLRKKIKDKLEYNYKLAREIAFDKKYLPQPVKNLLERYNSDKSIPATYHWVKYLKKYDPIR